MQSFRANSKSCKKANTAGIARPREEEKNNSFANQESGHGSQIKHGANFESDRRAKRSRNFSAKRRLVRFLAGWRPSNIVDPVIPSKSSPFPDQKCGMSDRTRLIGPVEDAGPKTKRGRHQTLRPHCQITGRGRGGLQARETETGKKRGSRERGGLWKRKKLH